MILISITIKIFWFPTRFEVDTLNVLTGQCLKRRIDDIEVVSKEVLAWQKYRNNKNAKVNWQFTTEDARIKLSRLYPTLED